MKEGSEPYVAKLEHKHDDSFESYACACMWRRSVSEALHIILHTRRIYPLRIHIFFQHLCIMYTLTTGQNLLTAQEYIGRVRIFWVVGVGHSVERSCGSWELVEYVVVREVLLLDELAKPNFVSRVEVFQRRGRVATLIRLAGIYKHLYSLFER